MTPPPRFNVLLIEDNAADVFLLKEALSTHAPCDFTVVGSGDQLFRLFAEPRPEPKPPAPDLVVLDLNLPGSDGVEILRFIRAHSELRDLAVAVVSSSPKDIMMKKTAQADCYLSKPIDLDAFLAMGKDLLACARARQRGAL